MTVPRALLDPRNVAIVGATDQSRQGRATFDNLQQQGFEGQVWLVNPRYRELFGRPCFPSILDLPEPVEAVVSALGASRSVRLIEECAQAGMKAAVIFADGFLESGPEGASRQRKLQEVAAAAGISVCGPNSMGMINVGAKLPLWMGVLNRAVPLGSIAAVVQSGTVGIALLNNERGLRFSHVISSGNEAVTSSAAFLEWLVDDPQVEILVNHLETLNDAQRYLAVLERAAALGKPLIVLKSGRSDQASRVIAGHTGRVVGSDLVARSVLRERGAIVVETLDELVETTYLLSHRRRPTGRRFGFVSISGGYSGLTADLASNAGLTCPPTIERTTAEGGPVWPPLPNFVDAWGDGNMEGLPEVLETAARAPNIDVVVVVFHLITDPLSGSPEFGRTMTRAVSATAGRHDRPILWVTPSAAPGDPEAMRTLEEAGVPCLRGLREGLAAIANATRATSAPADQPSRRRDSERASIDVLSEHRAKNWLEERGIKAPRRALARSEEEAAETAQIVGYPVVLKKQVRGVLHKTSRGYVRIGICDDDAVREAFRELMHRGRTEAPPDAVEGVLVEELIFPAVELMLSAFVDASFGPVVCLGFGGLAGELIPSRAIRLAPVDAAGAQAMIDEIGLTKLLARVLGNGRHRAVGEVARQVALLSQLCSRGAREVPALIEINPLSVAFDGRRVVAVDALVQLMPELEKGGACTATLDTGAVTLGPNSGPGPMV